ncbi:pro-kumamolisin, activation domain family [Weissella oryzae SG25]|uniref:Pro-kumamolisin, activation domain family n=1 Tax=Weissella oryzae (strain DSM 25784 / JCM 18191 / LMG 30913 / SG25) TaxID=1329250 RepID=A0A069CWZ5_WEIOS|nr:fibronectin type III domain-containing protein [Weissella oryzae]GAK32004.1 pro-kumamolisin, activation domain family [Weissella oryzae SG25]
MPKFDLYKGDTVAQSAVDSPIKIASLTPNTKYSDYSVAYTGKTEKTAIPEFTTSDVVPTKPTITVTAADGAVNYTITDGTNNGSTITGYKVYVDGTARDVTSKTGKIDSLTNGTKYTFAATAINGAGESAKSDETTATPTA